MSALRIITAEQAECNACGVMKPFSAFEGRPRRRRPECIECRAAFSDGERRRQAFVRRFWRRVEKREGDACWPWIGARGNHFGYGLVKRLGGTRTTAHRLAHELTYGPLPSHIFVLHTCDNPPCCRPDHTFPGTQADNLADAERKGRLRIRGEQNGMAILTAALVEELRERYRSGSLAVRDLAREYGFKPSTIRAAITGQNWREGHPCRPSTNRRSDTLTDALAVS